MKRPAVKAMATGRGPGLGGMWVTPGRDYSRSRGWRKACFFLTFAAGGPYDGAMRFHPKTKKAGEAAGREVAALPYREWRLAILAMLQQLEEDASEQGKEQAFGPLLHELKKVIEARVIIGHW